jgi:hypothetical protein
MTLINMSPTDFLRSGAFLTLTRRETLEERLATIEKLIARADEFDAEFIERQKARRDEIVKELAELENPADTAESY